MKKHILTWKGVVLVAFLGSVLLTLEAMIAGVIEQSSTQHQVVCVPTGVVEKDDRVVLNIRCGKRDFVLKDARITLAHIQVPLPSIACTVHSRGLVSCDQQGKVQLR